MTLILATIAALCLVALVGLVARLQHAAWVQNGIAREALKREAYYRESASQMFGWANALADCCEEQQEYIRNMNDDGEEWKNA